MPTSNFTSFLMNFATLADVKLDAKLNIVLVLKRTVPNAQTFVFALIAKINKIIMILLLGYFYYL